MRNAIKKYAAFEDSGGGLWLVLFNDDGGCIFLAENYEYNPGDLKHALEEIKDGANPIDEGWECMENPQEMYDQLCAPGCGFDVIADQDGIYPEKMGASGCREFGIQEG